MNKLTVLVHTPSEVGEASFTAEEVLNNKWLTWEQKQMLLNNMVPSVPQYVKDTVAVVYKGDKYFKVADGIQVTTVVDELYYSPKTKSYIQLKDKQIVETVNFY